MINTTITKIEFQYVNQPKHRRIKVWFGKKEYGYISPCYEAWENWHAYPDQKRVMVPIAEKFNAWLHGEDLAE